MPLQFDIRVTVNGYNSNTRKRNPSVDIDAKKTILLHNEIEALIDEVVLFVNDKEYILSLAHSRRVR